MLRKCAGDEAKFLEALGRIVDSINIEKVDLRKKKWKCHEFKREMWKDTIVEIDRKLELYVREYKNAGLPLESTLKKKIDLILAFFEKYYIVTKYRKHRHIILSLATLLPIEDWELTLKVLRIMSSFGKRTAARRKDNSYFDSPEAIQALLNIALGYNLKTSKRITFLEMLKDINIEVSFQYLTSGQEVKGKKPSPGASIPSIRAITISHLKGSKEDASKLAGELNKDNLISQELLPALCYKIRLAKNINSFECRASAVLSSLYAYLILCIYTFIMDLVRELKGEQDGKKLIAEAELKTTLITDLIQLLKYSGASTEIHIAVLDILTELVDKKSVFRSAMGSVGNDLGEEALRQLGVNNTSNGFFHSIVRDCTSLQVLKEEAIYRARIPHTGTEILSQSTAESPEFLSSLLYFLTCAHKNYEREDLNSQEASRFWRGVQTPLMNVLQVPLNYQWYIYNVGLTTQSVEILHMLSIKKSVEQDVTIVDAIITRLDYEINKLTTKKDTLFYAFPSSTEITFNPKSILHPELAQRQELCCALINLLSSGIDSNRIRRKLMY